MRTLIFSSLLLLLTVTVGFSQIVENWRGPDRKGIYNETGLLQEWPADGPEMIWATEELGEGFTSPVFANGKIYITGIEGEIGYVYELSFNGEVERKIAYGTEFTRSYPGSRSTPAIIDNLFYTVTGEGVVVCLNLESEQIVWTRDLFNDFDGRNTRFGITENLLVDGETLYVTPGGDRYNMVALNRFNNEIKWESKAAGGISAYCSPLMVNHNGVRMLITMTAHNIIGVNPDNGQLLWAHPYENSNNIHPNTPIYHNGRIFAFSGYGKGSIMLELNSAGTAVTEKWFIDQVDPQIGGAVLVDGFIYTSGDRNRRWFIVDWETGEEVYSTRDLDKGTVIYADNRLYIYTERGQLALVEPANNSLNIKGQTQITLGTAQHWAHNVIRDGVLYVRHGVAMMAFKIK